MQTAYVDLYWLPLGAGGHSVRYNGRVFESVVARLEKRPVRDLYHSALVVRVPDGEFVIEQAPAFHGDGGLRGVVAEGAVGSRRPRQATPLSLRDQMLAWRRHPGRERGRREPRRLTNDPASRSASSTSFADVPTPGLGTRRARCRRDVELELGDLLADRAQRHRTSMACIRQHDGRAPGWRAGVVVARRQTTSAARFASMPSSTWRSESENFSTPSRSSVSTTSL